jgi:hypothetical protein
MRSTLIAAVLLLVSVQAQAFKLYKTSSGKNVKWSSAMVEVVLDDSMAELGTREDVESVLKTAFGLWSRDASLPLSFKLVWDQCNEVSNDGNNCIFACHDRSLCYSRPEEKGGTTYISVSPSSGYISDVDIVLNADNWEWDVDGTNDRGLCMERVLSHEIGHFLGIDHSEERDAIMYPMMSRSAGEATELHWDDVDAAETLYENFVPIDGNETACSVSTVGASSTGSGYFLVYLIALVAAFRFRSRGRRENP